MAASNIYIYIWLRVKTLLPQIETITFRASDVYAVRQRHIDHKCFHAEASFEGMFRVCVSGIYFGGDGAGLISPLAVSSKCMHAVSNYTLQRIRP